MCGPGRCFVNNEREVEYFFVLQHSSEVNDFDFFALGKNKWFTKPKLETFWGDCNVMGVATVLSSLFRNNVWV